MEVVNEIEWVLFWSLSMCGFLKILGINCLLLRFKLIEKFLIEN